MATRSCASRRTAASSACTPVCAPSAKAATAKPVVNLRMPDSPKPLLLIAAAEREHQVVPRAGLRLFEPLAEEPVPADGDRDVLLAADRVHGRHAFGRGRQIVAPQHFA